ncbi:rhamnosyltransferase WsaF family glycosyltransferase [Bradyrhizobium sp. USDA 4353]
MSFERDVRAWYNYVRLYGFANATCYAMYKRFPQPFALLTQRIAANPAASSASSSLLNGLISSVFDFGAWSDFGGSESPAQQNSPAETLIWFVPDWSNVWGGGHYTLFRFANHLASRGLKNIIYIYNNHRHSTPHSLQKDLEMALKPCRIEVVVDPKKLPSCAGAVATTWQSAYHVRAFPFAREKFYFMQDYESLFYAFGTGSMQANETYSFGFHGITGGGWLRSRYEAHGGSAINYRFAADKDIFFPAEQGIVRDKVRRLFFYGRPSTERRCFELGMASLKAIAERYPDVEIVIAGLDLNSPPPFKATLLGNMSLQKTGDLYRTCDVGIAFSATNLSYLPVELMQSGVPVISNRGPQVEWHCLNMQNSLLVEATPKAVVAAFDKLYRSRDLRQKIVDGGLETMKELSWQDEMEKVYRYVAEKISLRSSIES